MDEKGQDFSYTRDQIRLLLEEDSMYYVENRRILSHKHQNLSLAFQHVDQYVFERLKRAYQILLKGQYFKALCEFRELQMIVDAYLSNSDGNLSEQTTIFLLVNLGVCFYRYRLYDDAFSCFESCQKRLRNNLLLLEKYTNDATESIESHAFAQQIRLTRHKLIYTKIKLVNGVILETVNRKSEALKSFKEAVSSNFDLVLDLVMLVTIEKGLLPVEEESKKQKKKHRYLLNQKKDGRSLSFRRTDHDKKGSAANSLQKNSHRERSSDKTKCDKLPKLLENPAEKLLFVFFKNILEIFPLFRKVYEKNEFFSKFFKLDSIQGIELPIAKIKQAFIKGQNIYSQSLDRMFQIKPVSYQQIHQSFFKQSMTLEFVLEIIIQVTLSLYRLSSLRLQRDFKSNKIRDMGSHSEMLMNKCLELAYSFLPISSLFVKEIIKKHSEMFGVYSQTIPQYGKMSEQLKFLRSSINQGPDNRFSIPCIRNFKIKKNQGKISDEELSDINKSKEKQQQKERKQENIQKTKRKKIESNSKRIMPTLFAKILKLIEHDEGIRIPKTPSTKCIPSKPSKCSSGLLRNTKTVAEQISRLPGSTTNLKKLPKSTQAGSRKNLHKN